MSRSVRLLLSASAGWLMYDVIMLLMHGWQFRVFSILCLIITSLILPSDPLDLTIHHHSRAYSIHLYQFASIIPYHWVSCHTIEVQCYLYSDILKLQISRHIKCIKLLCDNTVVDKLVTSYLVPLLQVWEIQNFLTVHGSATVNGKHF